jgi:hypothetical protein
VVVQDDVAVQSGLEIDRGVEPMGLQHLLDAAIETLHHAVGLGPTGWNQAVFDGLFGAESVDVMRARGLAGSGSGNGR